MPKADPFLQIRLAEFDDMRESELKLSARSPFDRRTNRGARFLNLRHRHQCAVTNKEGVRVRIDDEPPFILRIPDLGDEMTCCAIRRLRHNRAARSDADGLGSTDQRRRIVHAHRNGSFAIVSLLTRCPG